MANDAAKIRFAPNGSIFLAPTSPTLVLPTDVGAVGSTPAGYTALGYVDEAGVTLTPTVETSPVNVWQSAVPAVYNVTTSSFQISATLMETSKLTTELFYGASWVELLDETTQAPTGTYRLDFSSTPELDEWSIVVDWAQKDKQYRVVIGRAMISDRGAITLQRTESQRYELTINALDKDGKLGYLLSNDAALDATP